jgi:hypothetical protein
LRAAHVAASVARESDVPVVGSLGSETILVVEDEADVRSCLVEALQDLNYCDPGVSLLQKPLTQVMLAANQGHSRQAINSKWLCRQKLNAHGIRFQWIRFR